MKLEKTQFGSLPSGPECMFVFGLASLSFSRHAPVTHDEGACLCSCTFYIAFEQLKVQVPLKVMS